MSDSIQFHPEAKVEADDARDWYAEEAKKRRMFCLDFSMIMNVRGIGL
jgi:hypothetical protein